MVRRHALLSGAGDRAGPEVPDRSPAIHMAAAVRHPILRSFGLIAAAAVLLATPAWAQDKVSLQLKWKHQFQFAGYYMALEKGFYRAAGLDVEIREGGPGKDAIKDIGDGKADFGVCTTSVLLAKPFDPKLTVLAVVFQHSAAVILTPSRSRIA